MVLNYIHFRYVEAGLRRRPELVEWAKDGGLCKPKWLKPGAVHEESQDAGILGADLVRGCRPDRHYEDKARLAALDSIAGEGFTSGPGLGLESPLLRLILKVVGV